MKKNILGWIIKNILGWIVIIIFIGIFIIIGPGLLIVGSALIGQSVHIWATPSSTTVMNMEDYRGLQYNLCPEIKFPYGDSQRSFDLGEGYELYMGKYYSHLNLIFVKHENGIRYSTNLIKLKKNEIIKKQWKFFPLGWGKNCIGKVVVVKEETENSKIKFKITSSESSFLIFIVIAGIVLIFFGWVISKAMYDSF